MSWANVICLVVDSLKYFHVWYDVDALCKSVENKKAS